MWGEDETEFDSEISSLQKERAVWLGLGLGVRMCVCERERQTDGDDFLSL